MLVALESLILAKSEAGMTVYNLHSKLFGALYAQINRESDLEVIEQDNLQLLFPALLTI